MTSKTSGMFGLAILAIALLIYWAGLSGGFHFDDYANIVENDALKVERLDFESLKNAWFSSVTGNLGRPLAMLSFGLSYYAAGGSPFAFKLTNLGIHVLSALALFFLARSLLQIVSRNPGSQLTPFRVEALSLATAAAWLWHPLQVTSVLYVVQRMTSLSSLFIILGLLCFSLGRLSMLEGASRRGRGLVLASLFWALPAALSKEIGVLIPLYCAAIEFCLLGLRAPASGDRTFLRWFFGLTVLLPGILAVLVLVLHPERVFGGYEGRDFTLGQRLLTESRVLCLYLYLILLPNIRAMGLFHDDIAISTGLLNPPTTLLCLALLAALIVLAWRFRQRQPLFALAVLGFLAGHAMESTFIPLEIAHEHRNYVPAFFVLLGAVYYLDVALRTLPRPQVRFALIVVLLTTPALLTAVRAKSWGAPFDLVVTEAANHPQSATTQFELGSLYNKLLLAAPDRKDEFYELSRKAFEKSIANNPRHLSSLLALLVLSSHSGRPAEAQWLDQLLSGLREDKPIGASLLISLVDFTKCQQEGHCLLAPEDMMAIYQAALDNPKLRSANRALVLSVASKYSFSIPELHDRSLPLAYQAVEADPSELQFRLDLIEILIRLDQRDEARREIERARALDRFDRYRAPIDGLEQRI
jgi:tetratricopeptide (TPR) repeat protein